MTNSEIQQLPTILLENFPEKLQLYREAFSKKIKNVWDEFNFDYDAVDITSSASTNEDPTDEELQQAHNLLRNLHLQPPRPPQRSERDILALVTDYQTQLKSLLQSTL